MVLNYGSAQRIYMCVATSGRNQSKETKMSNSKTLTVRLLRNAAIANARWCEPVGWEPANVVDGSEMVDGSWWDDAEQTAGLVWFGNPTANVAGEVIEASLDDIRVASCGDCRVIGEVKL